MSIQRASTRAESSCVSQIAQLTSAQPVWPSNGPRTQRTRPAGGGALRLAAICSMCSSIAATNAFGCGVSVHCPRAPRAGRASSANNASGLRNRPPIQPRSPQSGSARPARSVRGHSISNTTSQSTPHTRRSASCPTSPPPRRASDADRETIDHTPLSDRQTAAQRISVPVVTTAHNPCGGAYAIRQNNAKIATNHCRGQPSDNRKSNGPKQRIRGMQTRRVANLSWHRPWNQMEPFTT